MNVWRLEWNEATHAFDANGHSPQADVILYFGPRKELEQQSVHATLKAGFPLAHVLGCTTGSIVDDGIVSDTGISAVAVSFETASARLVSTSILDLTSFEAGQQIGHKLCDNNLRAVFLLSDGLQVNGSALVQGLQDVLGNDVPIVGGLAGDGPAFECTHVGADDFSGSHLVAGLGLYGASLHVGVGAAHGWDYFGPPRRITASADAVLHELDGKPALDLYERYRGEEAKQLPAAALLYPLLISNPDDPSDQAVRTVLSIDSDARTMRFAGDMPEGWSARLMHGVLENLAAGAAEAARSAASQCSGDPALAVLISCVGRRLLMGQRTQDEIDNVLRCMPAHYIKTGFYSYGEIAAQGASGRCGLHNQTMTVFTLQERSPERSVN